MKLGQDFPVFNDWFFIHFTENPGMAFGLEFGGYAGKALLTISRIIVVSIGFFYVMNLSKKNISTGALISLGLIIGGAIGNIIDSCFYGIIFSDSIGMIADFLPDSGGYAPLLHGNVVDMLYFPLTSGVFPDWIPFFGGEAWLFFSPVFNMADVGISMGIFSIFLFYRKEFN